MSEENHVWRFLCIVPARAPILAHDTLAHPIIEHLKQAVVRQNGHLWGYVVLPDSVQFVVEMPTEHSYHLCVEDFKESCEPSLREVVEARHPELLDAITFYNPAWTKPLYLIWEAGYHTKLLSTAYALSNKVADLVNRPVELGLVDHPGDWKFSSYQSE